MSDKITLVFYLKPQKDKAVLKCRGKLNTTDNFFDEPIECNDNSSDKLTYPISNTIFARFYKCNVSDSYILSNKTIPIMYASIMYQSNIVGGLLLNIFVNFTVTSEIKSEKDLVGSQLDGKYAIEIRQDNIKEPKIIELDEYTNNKTMMEILKSIATSDEMKEVYEDLLKERRRERLAKFGSPSDIRMPSLNKVIKFDNLVADYQDN